MASRNKKLVRSNKQQINYLCHYMAQHPHFAAGDYRTPQGAATMERQWQELKAALDEQGPDRSVEQWKVCWRDQKRKARVEGGAVTQAANITGNHVAVPELSETSSLVLGTIGVEMASGFGPAESPIEFTASTSAAPLITLSQDVLLLPASQAIPPPAPQLAPAHASTCPPRPTRRSRVRKSHPPDRFLQAQETQNNTLKELVKEIQKITKILEQQNNILQNRRRRRSE